MEAAPAAAFCSEGRAAAPAPAPDDSSARSSAPKETVYAPAPDAFGYEARRRPAARPARTLAIRAASLRAAIIDAGFALPFPAMS